MCAPIVQWTAVVLAATSEQAAGSVSTYRMCMYTSAIKQLCRQTEHRRQRFCFTADAWRPPICQPFSKMPQVRTMHHKPGCVQTLPTGSKSSCLGRMDGSIVLSHLIRVPYGFSVSVPGCNDILGYLRTLL